VNRKSYIVIFFNQFGINFFSKIETERERERERERKRERERVINHRSKKKVNRNAKYFLLKKN